MSVGGFKMRQKGHKLVKMSHWATLIECAMTYGCHVFCTVVPCLLNGEIVGFFSKSMV